jgi:hypothetical protein
LSGDAGFASFWHGPLNGFAFACLASFPRAGAKLTLYAYDRTLAAPEGVIFEDARKICPDEGLIGRYRVEGKPSIATFSDMFRYRMIQETGACWVDADLLCLENPPFAGEPFVFCRQADAVSTLLVNNAVLRLPRDEPALLELIATAEAAAGQDQSWGALGPFLLTPLLKRHGLYEKALDPHVCFPVEPEQFWKLFLPEWRDWAAETVRGATFLHLWSEAIRWSGYDFCACPPEGSYLHERFTEARALPRFGRIAEAEETRRRMERHRASVAAKGATSRA